MGARVAQWVRSLDLTTHISLSPIRRGFAPSFRNYKKGALDSQPQVIKYQLLAHGRWFSPGTPASSTTKTGRMILLKYAESGVKHQNLNTSWVEASESVQVFIFCLYLYCRWRSNYTRGDSINRLNHVTRLCPSEAWTWISSKKYRGLFQWFDMRVRSSFCWYGRFVDHHCLNFLFINTQSLLPINT